MSELNKDGLVPGQAVDFETLNRIKKTHKVEAVINETDTTQPEIRKRRKHSLSSVDKTAKKKKAYKEYPGNT